MLIKCLSYVKCRKHFLNEKSSIKNSLKIHSLSPGSISMMKINSKINRPMTHFHHKKSKKSLDWLILI